QLFAEVLYFMRTTQAQGLPCTKVPRKFGAVTRPFFLSYMVCCSCCFTQTSLSGALYFEISPAWGGAWKYLAGEPGANYYLFVLLAATNKFGHTTAGLSGGTVTFRMAGDFGV